MTTLPNGMFPTLADTLGLTMRCNVQSQTVERLSAELAVACNERDDAVEQAIAAHELIDVQRAEIAGLTDALSIEGRFADYYRDEAIECASHLAVIDDLLTRVGIEDAPTIDRVNAVIALWLAAEARAQGLTNGDSAGANGRR